MHQMCAEKTNSVLKWEEPENIEEFCWDSLLTEAQTHAALFYECLHQNQKALL